MLPLGMLHTDDNIEAPDKHTGEYITHETHPGKRKLMSRSHPVSPSGHMSHNGASI